MADEQTTVEGSVRDCNEPIPEDDDVEITPEMIAAGVRAYFGPNSWYDPLASDHVQEIYRAMEAARAGG